MRGRGVVVGQSVGLEKLRRAKALRRSQTAEEDLLWRQLRTRKLHGLHFRRQQVIDGFIADFYCDAAGLVVELDGPPHQARAEYDAERDRILSAHRLRVLRFTNDEVTSDLPCILRQIALACGISS